MDKVAASIGCTKMTISRFENGGELSGKTNSSIRNFYESHGSSFPPMRITTVLGLRNDRCNPTSSCVLDSSSVNDNLDA